MTRADKRTREKRKQEAAKAGGGGGSAAVASKRGGGGGAKGEKAVACKPPNLPSKKGKITMLTKKQLIQQEKKNKRKRIKVSEEEISSIFGPIRSRSTRIQRQKGPSDGGGGGQQHQQHQQQPFTVVIDGVPMHHDYRSPINKKSKKKKMDKKQRAAAAAENAISNNNNNNYNYNNNRQNKKNNKNNNKKKRRNSSKPPFQLKTIRNPYDCIVPWWDGKKKRKEWLALAQNQSAMLLQQQSTTTTSSSSRGHYLFGSSNKNKDRPNEKFLLQLDAELEAFADYVQVSVEEIEARNFVVKTLEQLSKYNLDIVKSDRRLSQENVRVQVFGSFATPSVCAFCSDVDMALYGIVPIPTEAEAEAEPSNNNHIRFNAWDDDDDNHGEEDEDKKPAAKKTPPNDKVQKWRDLLRECDEKSNPAAPAAAAAAQDDNDDEDEQHPPTANTDDNNKKKEGWQSALDQMLEGATNCDTPDYRGRSDSCVSSTGGSYNHRLRSDSNVSTTSALHSSGAAADAEEEMLLLKAAAAAANNKQPEQEQEEMKQQSSHDDDDNAAFFVDLVSDEDHQSSSTIILSEKAKAFIEDAAMSMSRRLEELILELLEEHPDGITAAEIMNTIPGIAGYIKSCGHVPAGTGEYMSPAQLLPHCRGVIGRRTIDGQTLYFKKNQNGMENGKTTPTQPTQPEAVVQGNKGDKKSENDRKPVAKIILSASLPNPAPPPPQGEVIDVDQYEDAEEETAAETTTAGEDDDDEVEVISPPQAAAAASAGEEEEEAKGPPEESSFFVIDRAGAEVVDLNSDNDDNENDGEDNGAAAGGGGNDNNAINKNKDDAFTKMQNPRKRSLGDILSSGGSDSEDDTADKLASLHARKRFKPSSPHFDDASDNDDEDDMYFHPQFAAEEEEEEFAAAEQAVISLSSDDDDEDREGEEDEDDMHVSIVNTPDPPLKSFGPQGDVRVQVVNGLSALGSVLRRRPFTKNVQVIKGARVPIIKFETNLGFEGDVAMGGHNGTDTSQFASSQVNKFRSFSTVVMALKIMLRQQGLDTPFIGGLGSYKLYVLVAHHLERHLELGGCDRPSEVFLTFLYRYGINRGSGIFDRCDSRSRTFLQLSTTLECEGGYVADLSAVFLVKHCVDLFKRCFLRIGQESMYKKAPKQGSSILVDLFDVEQLVEDRTLSMEKASLLYQFCKKTKREKAAKAKREKNQKKASEGKKRTPKGSRQQNHMR